MKSREFWTLIATQYAIFCVAAIYYRAIDSGVLAYVFITAVLYSSTAFISIKCTAASTSKLAYLGYALGSGLGSITGVWLTHLLRGGK